MIGDERSFRGRRLGPRLKERRGSAAIRIHAAAFQRPPPARLAPPYSDPVRTRAGIGSRLCTIRLRPPNRRDRSASLNFLICAVRVGCDTYSTAAACVKLVSFATAMKELNYIASVSAPRALGICALNRLAQMGGFVQLTPESYNPPKLPIDTMASVDHGGCVLVETTPTLRWPAKQRLRPCCR